MMRNVENSLGRRVEWKNENKFVMFKNAREGLLSGGDVDEKRMRNC